MTRSAFEQPISPERDRNAARAHDRNGEGMGPKWHVYPELAAAGLWTTPTDLARFAIEVQQSARGDGNRVLSRNTVQEMLSPVGVGDFAVGFSLSRQGQGWYFSHGGSNWGFRCTLTAHKVKGYGLVIMTNGEQGGTVLAELSRRIQLAYGWDAKAEPVPRGYDPPVELTPIEVASEILETYVGVYVLSPDMSLVITLEDGRLFVEPTGLGKHAVVAESETKFVLRIAGARLTFTKDEAGHVTGLVLRRGGRDQPAAKER
jgi:hypothetical protein